MGLNPPNHRNMFPVSREYADRAVPMGRRVLRCVAFFGARQHTSRRAFPLYAHRLNLTNPLSSDMSDDNDHTTVRPAALLAACFAPFHRRGLPAAPHKGVDDPSASSRRRGLLCTRSSSRTLGTRRTRWANVRLGGTESRHAPHLTRTHPSPAHRGRWVGKEGCNRHDAWL